MFLKIIHKSEASYLSVCVVIRKEVVLNRLEDLLALSICTQNFLVPDIIMEGFKIEQKAEQSVRSLTTSLLIGNQMSNQTNLTSKNNYSYGYTWLKNIIREASCLNNVYVCNTHMAKP